MGLCVDKVSIDQPLSENLVELFPLQKTVHAQSHGHSHTMNFERSFQNGRLKYAHPDAENGGLQLSEYIRNKNKPEKYVRWFKITKMYEPLTLLVSPMDMRMFKITLKNQSNSLKVPSRLVIDS